MENALHVITFVASIVLPSFMMVKIQYAKNEQSAMAAVTSIAFHLVAYSILVISFFSLFRELLSDEPVTRRALAVVSGSMISIFMTIVALWLKWFLGYWSRQIELYKNLARRLG